MFYSNFLLNFIYITETFFLVALSFLGAVYMLREYKMRIYLSAKYPDILAEYLKIAGALYLYNLLRDVILGPDKFEKPFVSIDDIKIKNDFSTLKLLSKIVRIIMGILVFIPVSFYIYMLVQ